MREAVSSGPLINAGVKLLGSPSHSRIVEDFKNTLAKQATYTPDIWVSSHARQFNLTLSANPRTRITQPALAILPAYKAKIPSVRPPTKSNSLRSAHRRTRLFR